MAWRVFPIVESDPDLKPQWAELNIDDSLRPLPANETSGTIIFLTLKKRPAIIWPIFLMSVNCFQLLEHQWTLRRSWI